VSKIESYLVTGYQRLHTYNTIFYVGSIAVSLN